MKDLLSFKYPVHSAVVELIREGVAKLFHKV